MNNNDLNFGDSDYISAHTNLKTEITDINGVNTAYKLVKDVYIKLRDNIITDMKTHFPEELQDEEQKLKKETDSFINNMQVLHEKTVLVTGGLMQGSYKLNKIYLDAITELEEIDNHLKTAQEACSHGQPYDLATVRQSADEHVVTLEHNYDDLFSHAQKISKERSLTGKSFYQA